MTQRFDYERAYITLTGLSKHYLDRTTTAFCTEESRKMYLGLAKVLIDTAVFLKEMEGRAKDGDHSGESAEV